jgi:hypothetical protein
VARSKLGWQPGKRKSLAKIIKARLKEVKVGVLDDVLAEVMDANRGYNPDEMAVAYLLLLARRQAVGLVGSKPEEFREMVAKKVGGIVRRVEKKTPLHQALGGSSTALALPQQAAQVLALAGGNAHDADLEDRTHNLMSSFPQFNEGY